MSAILTVANGNSLDPKAIGLRIRSIRKRRLGMTQAEFAKALRLRRSVTISEWERGEYAPPIERLEEIAELAGVGLSELTADGAGGRVEEETAEEAATPSALDEWVKDFEQRVRYGVGKIPGISEYERRARISDAIEAQIQALQMIGDPVPARLYELREELKRGEL